VVSNQTEDISFRINDFKQAEHVLTPVLCWTLLSS